MNLTGFTWKLTAVYFDKETLSRHRQKFCRGNHSQSTTSYDYPLQIKIFEMGVFSGREKAEQTINASKKDQTFVNSLFKGNIIKCFLIKCFKIGTGWPRLVNVYVYTSDGLFYDGSLIDDSVNGDCQYGFLGRKKEQQKFKTGDIIEYMGNKEIRLGIIAGYSGDMERIQIGLAKLPFLDFDMSDDSYVVNYYEEEGEGLEGQTPHDHILSFYVFKPEGYISESIQAVLKTAVSE